MDDKQQHLDQYLALCKRIYERMERDGIWPWPDWREQPDSHESPDVLDSEDNSEKL